MISRNKEAIFMDNGKFQSHLLQDNAKVIEPSRYKNLKNTKNQQVLKPNVTNINANVDEDKLLLNESRFGGNFSSLQSKVMQMQSGKIKMQRGRNQKQRTQNQSMVVRGEGANMQFVLDASLNSSDVNAGKNFAIGRSYDRSLMEGSYGIKNQQLMNNEALNESLNFVHFAGFGQSKDQKSMNTTKSLGQQFIAQNSYRRMPVAQTFNLKQKLLTRFQNRINLEGHGNRADNWSPIKKNNMELSMEKAYKSNQQQTQSKFNSNSPNEQNSYSNNSKSRVFQTQDNGFFIPHQYQFQKMIQEQQLSVGQAQIDYTETETTPNDKQRISKLVTIPSRQTGINFKSKKFVGLQGMPLGSSAELNALSDQQTFGYTGSISGGHDTASDTATGGPTGQEAIRQCTQNSQSSKDAITPMGKKNQSMRFGLTNTSNFQQKSQEFTSKFQSNSKLLPQDTKGLLKFPQITFSQKKVHKLNSNSNDTKVAPFHKNLTQSPLFDPSKVPTKSEMELTAQPTNSFREIASIESSTKQPNSPQSKEDLYKGGEKQTNKNNQESCIQISEEFQGQNNNQGSRILQSIGSVQQHEFVVQQSGGEEQGKFMIGASVVKDRKQMSGQDSPNVATNTSKHSRNNQTVLLYRSFQGVEKGTGEVTVTSQGRHLTNQSPLLSQNRNYANSALKNVSIDDIIGKIASTNDSNLSKKRAIINRAKVQLSKHDQYHQEKKFAGGVRSYIPKSLSPLKNANRGSHIDQKDLENAFSRFKDNDSHQNKKSNNVISSKSQVQAQVNKRTKVNSDNDHGQKLGSSGYIKMGGIIQGFGSPYDLSNRKQTQKNLERALGTAVQHFDQASLSTPQPPSAINNLKRSTENPSNKDEFFFKSERDKVVSTKKQPELYEMSYEEKKSYIEDQVLKGSTEWEHLMQFAQNKIQIDTRAHVNRIESQRRMDQEKALQIAKRDPLYEYYQKIKEKEEGGQGCKDEKNVERKERKIPGVSTEPMILPQVQNPNTNANAEVELANSPNKVTKFLKNYKCKQMHPMMLQNRIPKGTSQVMRRSMVCKFKDCDHKIRNNEPYISCLKCGDFYCHEHIGIRQSDDLDDLKKRLGFISKKLQLQNKIAAIIIIIQEEKEKKRLEKLNQTPQNELSKIPGKAEQEQKSFKFKKKFEFKTVANDEKLEEELIELNQFFEDDIVQLSGDNQNQDVMKELYQQFKIQTGQDQEMQILHESSKDHLSPVDEEPSLLNPTPEELDLSLKGKVKLANSPSRQLTNPFKSQHTLSSPRDKPNDYQKRKKELLLKRIESKQKDMALKDRKVQADLRRSPIQRETNRYLESLNQKIDKIDFNDALQAHEQRKAAGRNKYISSEKKKEPKKSQYLNIQEYDPRNRRSSQASQASSSQNLMKGQRTSMSTTQQQFLKTQTESLSSYEAYTSQNSPARRSQQDDLFIKKLDLLSGADPLKQDEIGTIQEQVQALSKEINQKYDLFKSLKETDAYKRAQLKKQGDGKYNIANFLSDEDKRMLNDPTISKAEKDLIMTGAELKRQEIIKEDQRLKEEKKLQQIESSGRGMSSQDVMNLMNDDHLVDRYSKHLNKILFKHCDPFILKKYEGWLDMVEPSQQKDFFQRMKMDEKARQRKERDDQEMARDE